MTFAPYTGKQRRLRFRTYDLEWYPTNLEVRCVGEYGQDKGLEGYRSYLTVEDFLRDALTHENSGLTWFAHAGGLYDVQFLLELLATNPKYRLTAAFSGSSAIIVKVRETEGSNGWTFCDSFWLIRESLRNLAPMTGRAKGGKEYRCNTFPGCGHKEGGCIFYAPIPILLEYNALDCQILFEAIQILEERLLDLGGQLRKTIASCALHLFRARFLKREVETSDAVNDMAREAYIASRVEPYRRQCGPAYYYDINSSFPASMTSPQPGEVRGYGKRLPDPDKGELFAAHVRIKVPEVYLPPLPRRSAGRVFFPTGQWEAWLFPADVQALYEGGGSIESVLEVDYFRELTDFREYVETLYDLKKGAPDVATRQVAKYLLNSLYGKFAENTLKTGLIVRPKTTSCPHGGKHVIRQIIDGEIVQFSTCMTMLAPGVWAVEEQAEIPHEHVPISANITAESRLRQFRNLKAASDLGAIYYGDTDSTICERSLATSKELGGLKDEYPGPDGGPGLTSGEFLAPKLYRIRCVDGQTHIKAKGFHSLTDDQFDALKGGASLEYDHFCRIRETLKREKTFRPVQEQRTKRLLRQKPKRQWLANGDSRPWTVEELDIEEGES